MPTSDRVPLAAAAPPKPKPKEPPTPPRRIVPTALIAVLCLALGLAIATQVRRTNSADSLADQRPQDLVVLLDGLQQREAVLRKEIADAEAALARLQASGDSSAVALDEARRRADALAVLAGTAPASGPGLVIEVRDPDRGVAPSDLLDAVQELRAAGAEAIQVGDQRVGVESAFTGATGAVELDGVALAMPVTIVAIGDPPTLAAAVNIPGGVVDTVERAGGDVVVTQRDRVEVTALRAIRTPQYARPAG